MDAIGTMRQRLDELAQPAGLINVIDATNELIRRIHSVNYQLAALASDQRVWCLSPAINVNYDRAITGLSHRPPSTDQGGQQQASGWATRIG